MARRTARLGLSPRRATVLALVVCALALTLAVPLRTYLVQRQDLADTLSEQEALAAEVATLEQELVDVRDPARVATEARTRLRYVMPGQTPYSVQLPAGVEDTVESTEAPAPEAAPWYSELWSTVVESEPR